MASSREAWAAPAVAAWNAVAASIRSCASSGTVRAWSSWACGSASGAVRLTATWMPHSGSGLETGQSEPIASGGAGGVQHAEGEVVLALGVVR